ncbi:MAG: Transketolase [Anaerolineae bacterium]|nr:Transketolase [Anaerolineae bacterium]
MIELFLIPRPEIERIVHASIPDSARLALIADICRVNALTAVKRAGSGHLGSSFSAMDIIVTLYYRHMNTLRVGFENPARDIFFSSKGHDVPGLYALLYALDVLSQEQLLKLRRYGGLDGHPDIGIRGLEANSGSLGMGISKGRGMAWAKRQRALGGQVYVMIGDGELQEGQNYEALRAAAHQRIGNLNVLLDHNKVQTDTLVSEIMPLGKLDELFRDFGWRVARCDGHDFAQLDATLREFATIQDQPKILIADTLKGRGVSFMEHPQALQDGNGLYRWHAGAPADAAYRAAHAELVASINAHLASLQLAPVTLEFVPPEIQARPTGFVGTNNQLFGEQESQPAPQSGPVSDEYVATAFGDALTALGATHPELVVLDADLAADCRIRGFAQAHADRFIENGIAEQDMVSMAGGIARMGLLPVVNSFASFLAARANEQIYNNATEQTKIIYACHYAGLIPAGPGKSHQSIRDISLFGALPNVEILEPCNDVEAKWIAEYCITSAPENCAVRLVIGPSPRLITLPAAYQLQRGRGAILHDGADAVCFAYGPVMLHETLLAAEYLRTLGFGLRVINLPWLNRVDREWFADIVTPFKFLHVVEDHAPVGGLGDILLNELAATKQLDGKVFAKYGVEGFPAMGTPWEALERHRLSGARLAERILHAHDA